ncbi:hypothetical protein [Sinanaerobacter sp. ZZT-01]|uniref:hypothetical protein n=1 Tax=Sinanaerobacter sp. ZZT-01 TaxID=3111540 RepID=UPI002D771035|nr:hypothetical protein [Sinanaerobacter sp. ZZT-01]WRR92680.1 hypothetical protein U5921_11585 [Sinanaerobacter sp. ZZT-01]
MSKYGWVDECNILLEQVSTLSNSQEEVLAACLNLFKPYEGELVELIDNLKGIRDPLRGFVPYGIRKETHETFKYTYSCTDSAIKSLYTLKKDLKLYVARLTIPLISSSNNVSATNSEKFKEYEEDLLSVANKLDILRVLLEDTILKDTKEQNREVLRVVRKTIKEIINNLCWLTGEIDKNVNEVINSFVVSKVV